MSRKKKRFRDIPKCDRPREKILKKGVKSLSNLELASVCLGSGCRGQDLLKIAMALTKLVEKDFDGLSIKKLCEVNGIGEAIACRLLASIEFSKRFLLREGLKLINSEDIVALVEELRNKKQEYFLTFTIDGANNLIQKRTVFVGTLNQTVVHPREIFADAITDHAAAVIIVHNHPSGRSEPSQDDYVLTQRLVEAGRIVGVEVLDHIIVGKNSHFSFQEKGILRNL